MYGDNRVILARTSISIDDNINIGTVILTHTLG